MTTNQYFKFTKNPEKKKGLLDSLFDKPMFGIDKSSSSGALIQAENKNTNLATISTIKEYKEQQTTVYYAQQQLHSVFGVVPSETVTENLQNICVAVGQSSFQDWYRLPSMYSGHPTTVHVSIRIHKFMFNENIAKVLAGKLAGKIQSITYTAPIYTITVESDWMPENLDKIILLSPITQPKSKGKLALTGFVIDDGDMVLYKKNTDNDPIKPIVFGPCCNEWTPDKPFKNWVKQLLMLQIQQFSPSARLDNNLIIGLSVDQAKFLHVEGTITKKRKWLNRLDQFVLWPNDKLIEHMLSLSGQSGTIRSKMNEFRSRGLTILVMCFVVLALIIAGIVLFCTKRKSHKPRGVVKKVEKPISTKNRTILNGGSQPFETLSIMIDSLKNRVNNL